MLAFLIKLQVKYINNLNKLQQQDIMTKQMTNGVSFLHKSSIKEFIKKIIQFMMYLYRFKKK